MGIIWYELKRRIAILHKELMYHLVVVICSHRMDVSGRHTGFMKAVARQLQAGRTSLREMTRTSDPLSQIVSFTRETPTNIK